MEDHNDLLDNVPVAKVATKPDVLHDEDRNLPGEFFNKKEGLQIYILDRNSNSFEEQGSIKENKILFTMNNFSLSMGEKTTVINVSSLIMSCEAN